MLRRASHILCLVWLCALAHMPTPLAHASTHDSSQESQIKAAILVNLTRFSTWSNTKFISPSAPLNICGSKGDPVIEAIGNMGPKTARGHTIQTIVKTSKLLEKTPCHVIYFTTLPPNPDALNEYADKGILTIGSGAAFTKNGGGMSLYRVNNKMGFSINRSAMSRADIIPSSKILALANEVL